MITFIKAKFKKSDDQTDIDKHKVAANITEYQHKKEVGFEWFRELS